ncbi:hypothetical protein [Anatilimnocola floriformis]|uniref:hypothetical protein n=1 Tax=Anatilimnocola floriformis TaxID=2948575 RepID=UPI0020C51F4D|nr:hypothetical protein [Anatilimnocola floriformis]
MDDGVPELIAIDHDEYDARYIGRTPDGRQFILTTPFEPVTKKQPGAEFLALYLFDAEGQLLEAKIENLGPRSTMDEARRLKLRDQWLAELGDVSYERVEVAPFSVKRFGTEFGLIIREREDEDDVWAVEMQPGNYMAFFEPWDSGEYDT